MFSIILKITCFLKYAQSRWQSFGSMPRVCRGIFFQPDSLWIVNFVNSHVTELRWVLAGSKSDEIQSFADLARKNHCALHFLHLNCWADSKGGSLNYKASFRPNEVYMGREWRRFRNVNGDYLISKKRLQWKNSDLLVKAASSSITLD